jgi:serine/threonine-protein kinase RsbW
MSVLAKEYTDLDRALDEVRSILYDWSANVDESAAPRAETLRYTQLVLHEWIANLLQHGDFDGRAPAVEIRLTAENQHITCAVIDNSEGFDLNERLPSQDQTMEELPERGMGLRIIDACTGDLSYTPTDAGRYCFKFSIPADHDPWLSMLF